MAGGRGLQWHAKVSELSARAGAGIVQPPGARSRDKAEAQSSKLVSRCKLARLLLGPGTRLSPHRPDHDELRLARGVAPGVERRPGKPLATARAKSSRAQGRLESDGPSNRLAGRSSTLAAQRRDR